jgi:hypothetical protein
LLLSPILHAFSCKAQAETRKSLTICEILLSSKEEHTGRNLSGGIGIFLLDAVKTFEFCSMEEHLVQKIGKIAVSLLFAGAMSLSPSFALHAQTAGQDIHAAGTDTKNAADDTGHAVKHTTKKAYHKTKHGTKKAYHKTAAETDKGADKTKSGTAKAYDATKHDTVKVADKTKDGTVKASKATAHATENLGDKIAGKPAIH